MSNCLRTHALAKSGESDYNRLNTLLQTAAKGVSVLPNVAQHSLARLTRINMGNISSTLLLPRFIEENTLVKKVDRGLCIYPSTSESESESSPYFIFYIHGGAYEIGNPGTHLLFMRHLSYRTQCNVFGAKYITDNGIDRMHIKLGNALDEARKYFKETPIFVGDSAGGGLVMTFFNHLKKLNANKALLPSKNVLISPWVDLDFSDETNLPYDNSKEKLDFLPLSMVRRLASRICASIDCKADASKLLLTEPDKFWPPTLVLVGGDEVLGSSIRKTFYNRKPFVMITYANMKHVFPVLASFIDRTSLGALNDIAKFVRDDMVHITAHVIAFKQLDGVEYKNLQCVCKMRLSEHYASALACDRYLFFQKHDTIEHGIHLWTSNSGMFHWMCPATILKTGVTMDISFSNDAVVIREFNIDMSVGYTTRQCTLPAEAVAMQVTFEEGAESWTIASSIATTRSRADAFSSPD